jgi:hypothetical protein
MVNRFVSGFGCNWFVRLARHDECANHGVVVHFGGIRLLRHRDDLLRAQSHAFSVRNLAPLGEFRRHLYARRNLVGFVLNTEMRNRPAHRKAISHLKAAYYRLVWGKAASGL